MLLPPASSYLTMSSFSYYKLKKLPPPPPNPTQQEADQEEEERYSAAVVQDYYRHAAAAIVAARRRAPWRRRTSFASCGGGRRRRAPRRRLRISGLARVLRRKAAAVSGRVRASVAKVVGRFKEGGPYVGDLFAGNYMFLHVTPSAPAVAGVDKGFLPYYYAVKSKGTVQGLIRA